VRVVHIIWHLEVGGGELFLRDLALTLGGRGLEQQIFTVGPAGPVGQELVRSGIPVQSFHKSTKTGLVTIAAMARALRRIRPAVVHAHGEAGAIWGLPAARLAGVPSVALMYLNHEQRLLNMWAMRRTLRWPHRVLAGSAAVAGFLRDRLQVSNRRLDVVPCGINPALFRTRPVERSRQGPVIVSVGRLVRHKGHHVLIEAFAKVVNVNPRAILQIVGEGPERESLAQRARAIRLGEHIQFPGTVYPTADLLSRADLFVFPSLVEPQGLALLEAYASGVPVIASRTGGIVEMLEHEVDGLLTAPGDADDLASAILRMLDDAALRARSIEHGRSRLCEFDVRTIADAYLAIYRAASTRGPRAG
jgi:glycosyltransferase involved in cell wall biosynthesis